MGKLAIGMCSWTDRSLIQSGRFYPASARTPEERLRYYASVYPTVEVDSSFYALPTPENSARWVERTPDDFTFHVKAFGLFTTHAALASALPRDVRDTLPAEVREKPRLYPKDLPNEVQQELWRRFDEALLPLDSAGKLGVVLFQFPHWFAPNRENLELLLDRRERLPQYRIAVEFRSPHWYGEKTEGTLQFLRDHGLTYVSVDEPQGSRSSAPPIAAATTDIGYVRFHGRNADTWETKGAATSAERFDWVYSPEELREWVPRVHELQEQTQATYLMFNTNKGDQAVVNSATLAGLLGVGIQQGQLL